MEQGAGVQGTYGLGNDATITIAVTTAVERQKKGCKIMLRRSDLI